MRTRLTLTLSAVFLAAGTALIVFTISLARQSIDQATSSNAPADRALQSSIHDILATANLKAKRSGAPSATTSSSANPTQIPAANDRAGVLLKQKILDANRAYSASTGSSAVDRMITWSLVVAAVLVPLAVLLGWLLAGRALRPVRAVTAAAQRVSDSRLSERLNVTGPRDELTELAITFDAMMGRLETAFDAQRRFVANASHELRTPLAVAGTAVDVALAGPPRTRAQLEAMAMDVRSALTRAEEVVDSLLALTRSQHLEHRHDAVDLATLAQDALDTRRAAIAAQRLTVDAVLDEARSIGDRPLLERLVDNLVDNAVRHNQPHGWLGTRTGITTGAPSS